MPGTVISRRVKMSDEQEPVTEYVTWGSKGKQTEHAKPAAKVSTIPTPAAQNDAVASNKHAEEEYAWGVMGDPYTTPAPREDVNYSEMHHAAPRAVVEAAWACLDAVPAMEISRGTIVD